MSRNEHTGDEQRTKGVLGGKARAEYDRIFAPGPVKRGRYKQCRETGNFIPIDEWNEKYGSQPREKGPMVFVKGNFDAFESPTTGKVISTLRQRDYDMKVSGCRQYEGLEQEQKEVNRYLANEDKKLESTVSETVDETMYEIKHGYRKPQEIPSALNLPIGDTDE